MTWDDKFLSLAGVIATWSKDLSTKVGCVIVDEWHNVISIGYNGPPRGVRDQLARFERPAKYLWTSHAEENAVAQAAYNGHPLRAGIAYITHPPCCRCARMLIQAGVATVHFIPRSTNMPAEEFEIAALMFDEAGVSVHKHELM